ncbi:hypothetical protein N9M66_06250, partial [Litoreibacter sp.]|nr:hypothetical protein [Litoreibacter sp.]
KAKGAHYLPLLDAHRAFEQWPAEIEFRYALHRQVQASCFKRLGHLSASQISANIFAPTLYASMPSRVVRLSSEGYLFLRRLMLGLSQYPDIRQEDAARDRSIFNDDNIITRVQALRAALSMVRGTFSIAAVSRFTNDTTGLDFTRKRGYFDTYKVRLRWILRKSWEIHTMREAEDPKRFRVNALYRDEIIWLYNEVAVTCLVQGNLIDGIGHARQALHLNKEIEGERPGGRMHNMISLNIAIMQIDRGRLASAKRRLREIIHTEDPKHRRVYHLARGYRGLITHLQGNREDAAIEFQKVMKGQSYGEEDRARAILANHYAHVIAHNDPDAAAREIDRAREYAESGGHEDIRSRIIVSEVWLRQLVQHDNQAVANDDRGKLDKIQEYARMMGMDSLLVDTLHTQARMLLLAGDSSSSGRLMTRAMAVARRNSMNLRLILCEGADDPRPQGRRPQVARRVADNGQAPSVRPGGYPCP